MIRRWVLVKLFLLLTILPALAFWQSRDSNYNIAIGGGGGGGGNASTPIFSSVQLPNTGASANVFGATQCPLSISTNCYSTASSTVRRVPMPFAGTINGTTVVAQLGTAPAAAVTITSNINNVDGSVVCTFAIGVQTGSCSGSDSVPANAAFQWHFSSTNWNQTALSQISFLYTAASGQHIVMLIQPGTSGIGASAAFYGFPGTANTPTQSNATSIVCQGCAGTINGIAVLPNVAENGSNVHTYSLEINGTAIMSCSGTLSSAAVCTATGSVAVSPGDSIVMLATCSTSCSSTLPGLGVDFTPNTQNVVPIFANENSQGAPHFLGLSDYVAAAGQTNFQMVPAAMTFSSYQICGLGATTGTQTRKTILQGQASPVPGAAPTVTELTATITNGTGACPGSQGATYLSGATTGGTYSAAAGSTIDHAYTVTNAPTNTAIKISAAVTVP